VSVPARQNRATPSNPDQRGFLCEVNEFYDKIFGRGGYVQRLARDMRKKSKQPFSNRTKQISVLLAFVPFVVSMLAAGLRFMPMMPAMPLWSKMTWFIAFPMFMGVTGGLVGFLIGVMLDTIDNQVSLKGESDVDSEASETGHSSAISSPGVKTSVWVAVDDLEPNQRVAETVLGQDGTPLLLRHTLLKPSHIDILKNQNIEKIRVEAVKYPTEGDLAIAG
jgi:hypothetical protein